MIFATDKGRMCNNILQYGHVYAWAREHGRQCVSMRFSYKYQYFAICHKRWHNFAVYALVKYLSKLGLISTVKFHDTSDETRQRNEKWMEKHRTFLVKGWGVRFYDLFLKYKQEIISLFEFDESISTATRSYMGSKGDDTLKLGVHIRRGDYSKWHGGKYFFSDEVYASFIKAFVDMHPEKKVAVFLSTNDGKVTEENYRRLAGHDAIYKFDKGPAEDLCMLSECDYIIGPPSTFSLVASMYHDRPLHWMSSSEPASMEENGFHGFDKLFREII